MVGGGAARAKLRQRARGEGNLGDVFRQFDHRGARLLPSLTRVIFPHGAEDYLPVWIHDEKGRASDDMMYGGTLELAEPVDPEGGMVWRTRDGRIASLGLL